LTAVRGLTVYVASVIVAAAAGVAVALTALPPTYLLAVPSIAGVILALSALRGANIRDRFTVPRIAPRDIPARLAVGALVVGLILSTWNGVRITSNMTASDPFLVIAGVAAALAPRPRLRLAPVWLLVPAAAILEDVLVNWVIYGGGTAAVTPGLRLVLAMALTPLVIGLVAGAFGALWMLLDCWILSAAVNCAVAAVDGLAHTHIGASVTGVLAFHRWSGLTTQSNHLAFVAVLALPAILARLLMARSGIVRGYYAAIAVIAMLGLLESGSRGGLVGAVVVLLATPIFQRSVRAQATMVLAGAVALTVITAVFAFGATSFVTIQRVSGAAPLSTGVLESDALRSVAYATAWDQFSTHPIIGVGWATPRQAQSLYLELAASGGIVAFCAFAAFLAGGILEGYDLARRAADPRLTALAGAAGTSMLAWAVMGVVENQVYDRYLLVPCGFLLAVRMILTTRRVVRPASAPHALITPPGTTDHGSVVADAVANTSCSTPIVPPNSSALKLFDRVDQSDLRRAGRDRERRGRGVAQTTIQRGIADKVLVYPKSDPPEAW
jgi:O-antigen ligase